MQNHFTMMPKKNNLLFFLKVTLLWCPRILKKTCNLRHRLGKIILLWYPKNTDNLKSHYYDAGKYWKNYVFKPWPSQNHATMIPNKCIFVDILVKITLFWCPKILMPENIEKQTCTFKTRSNALMFSWYQNRLLDAQNKLPHTIIRLQKAQNRLPEVNIWLINVKSWYYDAQKIF